jgi:hypothetical protein
MDNSSPSPRSTFLTVLCILSFAGGSWNLWSGYRNAFTDAPQEGMVQAREKLEEAKADLGDDPMPVVDELMGSTIAMAESANVHAKELGYGELLMAVLSLFGVWNMWNLRKRGFWIYLAASVGALVIPATILGGGLMASIGITFMGFISLVFVVLYALNLKEMR